MRFNIWSSRLKKKKKAFEQIDKKKLIISGKYNILINGKSSLYPWIFVGLNLWDEDQNECSWF